MKRKTRQIKNEDIQITIYPKTGAKTGRNTGKKEGCLPVKQAGF